MIAPNPDQTVFVVEDDDSVRTSIRLLLKAAGYKVETYTTASEFLEGGGIAKPGCSPRSSRGSWFSLPGLTGLC